MLRYLLKRLLLFIPTLLAISFIAFGLSRCTPGDPVDNYLPQDEGSTRSVSGYLAYQRAYAEIARQLYLDRPVFYLGVQPAAYPDTLHRVLPSSRRQTLTHLLDYYGNWPAVQTYYRQLQQAELAVAARTGGYRGDELIALRNGVRQLYFVDDPDYARSLLDTLREVTGRDTLLRRRLTGAVDSLRAAFARLEDNPTRGRLLLPTVRWYGADNQYHRWITGFVYGDFGKSYRDRRPVADIIGDAVAWTVVLNGVAIALAYLLSIPIGVYAAARRGERFDRWTTFGLFLLYSLPNFWIATLLTVFLTNPEYGMDWFPAMGVGDVPPEAGWLDWLGTRAWHLFLPILCLTYGSLAFISRQMRGAMAQVLEQDYIRTAWAKGLSGRQVLWKHAFRNALFPIITLLAGVLPAALAGSVVIEVIFNIPGMGKVTVDAIFAKDWPVVYTLLMLAGLLTVAGILLADILYVLADPRVGYRKTVD